MPYPPATWRLLSTGFADGATNMAVDEAILLCVAAGESPPTLRFYGWQPPCLSIGCHQSMLDEVDVEVCRRDGVTWVRRPTGGRAILHTDELTYSVIAPISEPRVRGGVVESYRRLSRGLVTGLRRLGVDAVQANAQRGDVEDKSAACFDAPSHYEVTVRGKKLVGSAQVRRRGAVLQHGSLPLYGDLTRIFRYLRLPEDERERLSQQLLARATTLEAVLGQTVPLQQVVDALAQGFAEALNLRLMPGELTVREREEAARLRREKYASDAWNRRK